MGRKPIRIGAAVLSRIVRSEVVFFMLAWPILAVLYRARAFVDPGTFWHIRVGDLIRESGFMTTDPFTFPFAGKTWIPQQWGGEVVMSIIHSALGFDGLLFGMTGMLAGLFAWVFHRLLVGGMGWPLAGIVSSLGMMAAGFHFYARPHLITIAFMAIVAAFIVDFDRRKIGRGRLLLLIPLHLVWTNIHGGMLGGVATLALAGIGWAIFRSVHRAELFAYFGIVAMCALTMFANPFGLEMQRTWFRIVGSGAMAQYVDEHTMLNPERPGDQAVLAFAAVYLVVLFGAKWRDFRITWLLPLVWFALTVKSIRQGPLFVVVGTVLLADIWPHTFWHRYLCRKGDTLARDVATPLPPITWHAWLLPVIAITTAISLQAYRGIGLAQLDPSLVPVTLIEPLQNYAATVPPGTRIYNDANLGGFVIYHAPKLKIFMDDRFELCGDAWLTNYVETIRDHPERFEGWYREYGFEVAIVAASKPILPLEQSMRDSGHWQEIARDRIAVMYRRTTR